MVLAGQLEGAGVGKRTADTSTVHCQRAEHGGYGNTRKRPNDSNTGEVLLPGGHTLTADNPQSGTSTPYPNISSPAGTAFAAPASSVFAALDFTEVRPSCWPNPVSPPAFFRTDLPLADAVNRHCLALCGGSSFTASGSSATG